MFTLALYYLELALKLASEAKQCAIQADKFAKTCEEQAKIERRYADGLGID